MVSFLHCDALRQGERGMMGNNQVRAADMTEQDTANAGQDAAKQRRTKHGVMWWVLSPLRGYAWVFNKLFDFDGFFFWLVGETDTFKWRWIIFWSFSLLGNIGWIVWKAVHTQDWFRLIDALWPITVFLLGGLCRKTAKVWRERANNARRVAEELLDLDRSAIEKALALIESLFSKLEESVALNEEMLADKKESTTFLERVAERVGEMNTELSPIKDTLTELNENLNVSVGDEPLTIVEMADRAFKEYEQRIAALEAELNMERGLVGFDEFFQGRRKKSQAILKRYELFQQIEKDYPTLTNQAKASKATERARGEIEGELARGRRSNGNIETEIILEMSRRYKAKAAGFSQTDIENYHRDLGKEINRRNAQ